MLDEDFWIDEEKGSDKAIFKAGLTTHLLPHNMWRGFPNFEAALKNGTATLYNFAEECRVDSERRTRR